MKNIKPFPKNINITQKGSNVKNRISVNYKRWEAYSTKKSEKKHKSLTDYANECLGKKRVQKLLDLYYDFTRSRMAVTRLKHDCIMSCKKNHFSGNFEERLIACIKTDTLRLVTSGQMRNSDKFILQP